ncbi:MAG: KpsF/GutQ family sugar-phosphate isomerase [Candidatus Cloacimonetes bacterium]|nr:KpsF/GutQ family sugar-phosphate isomerase [Candidatus Cloacimonadota bacterium]
MDMTKFIKDELNLEAKAIREVAERLDPKIEEVIDLIFNCRGKVVVTGMGKAGIIARKIASTFVSTGTTAIFLHAAEGIHGDLGLLNDDDIVIAVSNSGNTEELISIIPFIKFKKIPIIALTGQLDSKLALNSNLIIDCHVPKSYEPFGLVPTSSTTVALAMGDAIAVALLKKRNFQEDDFAKFHPGGTIGKKLLIRVADLMHQDIPIVFDSDNMETTITKMLEFNIGGTIVINAENVLIGIITDGDLKRILLKNHHDIMNRSVEEVMTKAPKTILQQTLAIEALNLMEDNNITLLPVVDDLKKPVGILQMHDLIKAGVVG